jgi:tRNA (guanine-N7-)-methyltransferase
VHRRLITPSFLTLVHRSLLPGGIFVIQTDNPGYWRYIKAVVPMFFDFSEHVGSWPDSPKGRSRREIIARRKGLPIFRGVARAKTALSNIEALRLAEALPPPVFDADRRYREADLLDRG